MTRKPLARALVLAVVILTAPALARAAEHASLAYIITPIVTSQAFHVEVRVAGATEPAVEIRMPSWQPASYAMQPYAAAASNVEARDEAGSALDVSRPDDAAWRVAADGRPFTISYDLDVSDK